MNTIKIIKVCQRGRKYHQCQLGRYKAKLIVNDVSRDLLEGDEVVLEVADCSTHTRYGTDLCYRPLRVLADDSDEAKAVRQAVDHARAVTWIKLAMDDVAAGKSKSGAIDKALSLGAAHDDLSNDVRILQERVKSADVRRWLQYAEQDVADSKYHSNAITIALRDGAGCADLRDRVLALQARVKLNDALSSVNMDLFDDEALATIDEALSLCKTMSDSRTVERREYVQAKLAAFKKTEVESHA